VSGPPEGADPDRIELLVAGTDGRRLGVGVGRVDDVLPAPATTRVPRTPPVVRGVARVANSTAVVVDGRRLHAGDGGESAGRDGAADGTTEPETLLIDRDDATPVALLVDRVMGSRTLSVGAIEPPAAADAAVARPSLYAGIARPSAADPIRVLSIGGLVDAVRPAGGASHPVRDAGLEPRRARRRSRPASD